MALFSNLALLADQLATEPSRLKKRAAIAAALHSVATNTPIEAVILTLNEVKGKNPGISPARPTTPNEAPTLDTAALTNAGLFALYLAGQPFPEADPRKLNTGGALLTRALLTVSHATDAALTAAYRRHGDLGAAAFDLLQQQTTSATLTLADL